MLKEYEWCRQCGREYKTVYRVSDDLWQAITGHKESCYCPKCFDEMAREKGIGLYWEASESRYPTTKAYP